MRFLRQTAGWLLLLFAVSMFQMDFGHAQTSATPDIKPLSNRHLMVPPRNSDGTIRVTPFSEDPLLWVRDEQQNFYASLSGALRGVNGEQPERAAMMLLLISFAYGVFHAAGPGHGKAVISGWLFATEGQLRRGILLAWMSAMLQSFVAVAVVSAILLLLNGAATAARSAANVLEVASYLMIAAMGLYLVWTGLRPIVSKARLASEGAGHLIATTSGQYFEIVNPLPNVPLAVGHVHGPDCGCDHAHLPDSKEVSGDWSFRKAVSLTLAVGLRPCTGAILVLLFANNIGIYWAGVVATFAMGLGTFITVSGIAALAVYSRKLAMRLAQRDDLWLNRLNLGMRLGGGIAIFAMGATMAMAFVAGSGPTGM